MFLRFLLLNALLHLPSLFFMVVDICSSKEFWFSLPHRKLSPPSSFVLSPLGSPWAAERLIFHCACLLFAFFSWMETEVMTPPHPVASVATTVPDAVVFGGDMKGVADSWQPPAFTLLLVHLSQWDRKAVPQLGLMMHACNSNTGG